MFRRGVLLGVLAGTVSQLSYGTLLAFPFVVRAYLSWREFCRAVDRWNLTLELTNAELDFIAKYRNDEEITE